MNHPDDTIAAISSAPGPGARAVLRLSGPKTKTIITDLCPGFTATPNAIHAGSLRIGGLHSSLPADLYFFQSPRSYTGEDLAEIHTVSSPPILEALMAQILNAGARAAGPGEFTQRAFLAGKIDLTRAEAVQAVIESRRDDDLKTALGQLAGNLARPLDTLRDDLLNLLADLEAALDFADEDIEFVSAGDTLTRIAKALAHLANLQKQLDSRSHSRTAFRVALAGPPNAGKSSLFNLLAGMDAAIVSPIPGTTRDYLTAVIRLGESEIELADTAGLQTTDDFIDSQSQSHGADQTAKADLILWCDEAGSPPAVPGEVLRVRTKCDLHRTAIDGTVAVSTVTLEGKEVLKTLLAQKALSWSRPPLAPSHSRCRHHLDAAVHSLRRAHEHLLQQDPAELTALELRLTLAEIGAMAGAVYTNDLLDRIFSRFCIGK